MFFGNMQSFYRRNPIYNQTSSKPTKEQTKRKQYFSKHKTEEDSVHNGVPPRRSSFCISRSEDCQEPVNESSKTDVPVIKVGFYEPETSKKPNNILKEKEKALWCKIRSPTDDNRERLGPNKNNIIGETLEIERRKSADWGK